MTDKLKEYCGLFGISTNDYSYSIAGLIYPGLMAIQHRGQSFAGIATTDCNGAIVSYRARGLVSKALNTKKLRAFSGNVGIGHVCYGGSNVDDAPPFYLKTEQCELAIGFNGSITNHNEIRDRLQKMGKILISGTDIELLAILIESFLKFSDDILETLKTISNILEGSFCIIIIEGDGTLYALRDPIGYKPLCYGTLELNNKFFHVVASETCSLDALGGKFEDDVKPGEILKISIIDGLKKYKITSLKSPHTCQFEYTYFARPDSIIDGISVAEVRLNLGKSLAREDDISSKDAIVVPVPDSGRLAAMGYAMESGINYKEGLMKNRYIWHSNSDVEEKLNPIKPIVNGKNVILIDDSIVSGNTMKKIVSMLRNVGAKSIHVRIACPPIINKCEMNSNFSKRSRLIAYQKKLKHYNNFNEELQKYIKSDSLKYQTIDGLKETFGRGNPFCISCLTEYCLVKDEEGPELNLIM